MRLAPLQCPTSGQLPLLYLADCIIKTVGEPYKSLFCPALPTVSEFSARAVMACVPIYWSLECSEPSSCALSQMFAYVWKSAQPDVKRSLTKLADTWRGLLPDITVALVESAMAPPVGGSTASVSHVLQPAPLLHQGPPQNQCHQQPTYRGDPRLMAVSLPQPPPPPRIGYNQGQAYISAPPAATSSASAILSSVSPGMDLMSSLQSLTNRLQQGASGGGSVMGAPSAQPQQPLPLGGQTVAQRQGGATAEGSAIGGQERQQQLQQQRRFGKVLGSLSFNPPSILKVRPLERHLSCAAAAYGRCLDLGRGACLCLCVCLVCLHAACCKQSPCSACGFGLSSLILRLFSII